MSKKEVVIDVRNLNKRFSLHQRENNLKRLLINALTGRTRQASKLQVLRNLSFSVEKGEFFGIVGRNGSGKSTLLKTLAGVYLPDEGTVEVRGSLTPFIELGVGFNPELSGRDNVFLNGALLGFNRKEMRDMYENVVEFAELSDFMDEKLKNYSSGMQVRLAFSIAIHAKSDILLIDEVLAVGDANFQKKCLQQFRRFKRDGKTIIFVSHSMEMIEKFCDRAMMLKDGRIFKVGNPSDIAFEYVKDNSEPSEVQLSSTEVGNMRVVLKNVESNLPQGNMITGGELTISALYERKDQSVKSMYMAVGIYRSEGLYMVGADMKLDRHEPISVKEQGKIMLVITDMPLLSGDYIVNVAIYEDDIENPLHFIRGAKDFIVIDSRNYRGYVKTRNRWVAK